MLRKKTRKKNWQVSREIYSKFISFCHNFALQNYIKISPIFLSWSNKGHKTGKYWDIPLCATCKLGAIIKIFTMHLVRFWGNYKVFGQNIHPWTRAWQLAFESLMLWYGMLYRSIIEHYLRLWGLWACKHTQHTQLCLVHLGKPSKRNCKRPLRLYEDSISVRFTTQVGISILFDSPCWCDVKLKLFY